MTHTRFAPFLIVLPLLLVGCSNSSTTERPQLLAANEARFGDVSRLSRENFAAGVDTALSDYSTEAVRVTACSLDQDDSVRPKLVIGRQPCVVTDGVSSIRID